MEVGYKQANQTQIQQGSRPQGGGSNWGLGGTYNLYIAGSVSIISLIGLAFIK
jgi:hypothetical protein